MVLGEIKAIGQAFSTVLKGLEIGSGVGIIVQILEDFKPLASTLGAVMSMLGLLLSPISLLITGALMPILLILKPFVIAAQKVMLPFLELALEAMGEGASLITGGDFTEGMSLLTVGAGILLTGLGTVITTLSYQAIIMTGEVILSLLLDILDLFLPIGESAKDSILDGFSSLTGTLFSTIIDGQIEAVAAFATTAGLDSTQFETDAKAQIYDMFLGDAGVENMFTDKVLAFTEANETAIQTFLGNGPLGMAGMISAWAGELGTLGTEKVTSIIAAARAEAERIKEEARSTYTLGIL